MKDLPVVSADRPVNLAPPRREAARGRAARGPIRIRLWIPLTPLLGLLSPIVLLAAPLARLNRRTRHVPTVRAAWALGSVLMALSGTTVSVETREAVIRIYIF
jgi:hypothetical protein